LRNLTPFDLPLIMSHMLSDVVLIVYQMMTSRPRSDIYINLPALQKLDTMLIVRQTSIASCL